MVCLRKELLSNILSLRYGIVLCVFVLLTLAATAVRTHLYQKQTQDHAEAQQERTHIVERIHNAHFSEAIGHRVAAPPSRLAIFANGLEDEMTRPADFSGIITWNIYDRSDLKVGLRRHAVPSYRYGLRLDIVTIINLVASLFALLLVFDGVCGEKENGTLKLLLSGPLPRDTVILSKMAAGAITLLVPLVISWAASVLYVTVAAGVALDTEHLVRVLLMAGLSCLYVTVCFSVGVAVSVLVHRSATALAACLSLWVFVVLLIPNMVPLLVSQFVPAPSQSKILAEKDAIHLDLFEKELPKMRDRLNQESTYSSDMIWFALTRVFRLELHRRTARVDEFHTSRISRQVRVNEALSRCSPSAAYLFAAARCAGSAPRDYLRHVRALTGYERRYLGVREDQNKAMVDDGRGRAPLDASLWPAFVPASEPLDRTLAGCWLDVALLCSMAVVFLLLAYVRFLRYDVR
jgi:ABC-type transport system involved in multi-copper enzyme maturation permease subunit